MAILYDVGYRERRKPTKVTKSFVTNFVNRWLCVMCVCPRRSFLRTTLSLHVSCRPPSSAILTKGFTVCSCVVLVFHSFCHTPQIVLCRYYVTEGFCGRVLTCCLPGSLVCFLVAHDASVPRNPYKYDVRSCLCSLVCSFLYL